MLYRLFTILAQHPIIVKQLEQVSDDDGIVISILTVYEMEYAYANAPEQKQLYILKPVLEEQIKIAKILTSIGTNIEQKQTKLTQSKNLKKSLMADLLTGRVRVNTWAKKTSWLLRERMVQAKPL